MNTFSLGDMDMAYGQGQTSVRRSSTGTHVALWIVQVVLGLLFVAVGAMKVSQSISNLAASLPWVTTVSPALVRFIGISELLGGLGLIAPAATRIAPVLTPLSGAALTIVMLLASAFHLSRGEFGVLPVPVFLAAFAAFVAWGRWSEVRIKAR
jgi:putative oxidoreductase